MRDLAIRYDRETDGRVIAMIDVLPGCMVYGADRAEARRKVITLAFAILADLLEHGEWDEHVSGIRFADAA